MLKQKWRACSAEVRRDAASGNDLLRLESMYVWSGTMCCSSDGTFFNKAKDHDILVFSSADAPVASPAQLLESCGIYFHKKAIEII
jgi:hypothetical protein